MNVYDQIRRLVDTHGWDAARKHPTLGPIVRQQEEDQRRFEDRLEG